ncbi:hypothetical protein H8B06_07720 [Sphingobacterium sp. DN00404]|uniref:Transcriptional regulator, AbiEi antitoxin, Type IV TA system n=2 Tax=Sphingobacterium micropteri TaxID=2763501 RepID=A0ABR7YNB0_9SPHI|nr:hypothetical protein [Sphingobacterium micropteri]
MTLTTQIRNRIKQFPEGKTFGYDDLRIAKEDYTTASKTLERLQKSGLIKKISKGVFYRPKQTIFGELPPNYSVLLQDLYLFENGKRIGYVTGTSLYNQLYLTTQIPFSTKIATNKRRGKVTLGWEKATFTKAYTEVTENNYKLLGLLDALKDFKKIPDLDKNSAIKILSTKLKELNPTEIKLLIKCGLAYPPRVRSFLGALLENIKTENDLTALKTSLNPLSEYEYGIGNRQLPTAENWNIK